MRRRTIRSARPWTRCSRSWNVSEDRSGAEFVLVPLLVIVAIGILVHVWAFRTLGRSYVAPIVAVALVLLAGATTAVRSRQAFGGWVPRLGTDEIDQNDDQITRASQGTPVVYHLELHNPFARSAKTYLVGTFGGRPFRVALPLGRLDAYGEAITPSDWVTLSPTSKANVFEATVTVIPSRVYRFAVDLGRDTATLQERRLR
jgi:hypothetical protein